MLSLLVLHVALALAVLPLAARFGARVFLVGALAPAVAFGWLVVVAGGVLTGAERTASLEWAPALDLVVPLRLDALALITALLVTGVGAIVLAYAGRYFVDRTEGLGRTSSVLVIFAGAMLGLVLSDNLLALYVFWEVTTVCSFALIGDDGRSRESRRAAMQALIVTTGGGLTMLGGLVLLGVQAGTWRISEIVESPPTGPAVSVAVVLVLIGAFAKSAQVPFHPWLPTAMVAPTPISAYLHAAAMVKAGIYLIARLAPAFAETEAGLWRPLVVTVGLVTMLLGGWRAIAQTDLKRLLAFGTISQLGFLVVLLGAGTRTAALAGATMLLAHGLFKATLFCVVGIIDHEAGTRDLRELSGVRHRARGLTLVAVLACASMAGLPLTVGYLGKEAAYEAFVEPYPGGYLVLAGIVAGSVLTVAYTLRFLWGAFSDREGVEVRMHAPPRSFTAPAAVMAVSGVVLGVLPHRVGILTSEYAGALPSEGAHYELALWHGFTTVFWLTALTVAAGVAVHLGRRSVRRLRAGTPSPPRAQRLQERLATTTVRFAKVVTTRTQVGSLPAYLGVLFLTFVTLPGASLLLRTGIPGDIRLWDTPAQAVIGAGIAATAIAVVLFRRRLVAVLVLSSTGYLVAALFVLQGAPDLALTQFLVETITLVVLVIVLRRTPHDFTRTARVSRVVRGAVAVTVGAFITTVVLVMTANAQPSRVSPDYFRLSAEAGGENIVNLIIVDFRALDTLGEVTVLAIAATGVASLVLVSRRTGGAPRRTRVHRRALRRRRAR